LNAAGEKPLLHGTNHAAAAFFIFEFFLLMAGKLYSPLFIHLKRRKNESRTYFIDRMQEKLNERMLRDEELERMRK
jgi:hypothetical protein